MYLQCTGCVGNEGNQLEEGDEEDVLPSQMVKMKTMVEAPKILANHLKMMIMGPNMMTNYSSTGGEGV
jgi:hypothetical protein